MCAVEGDSQLGCLGAIYECSVSLNMGQRELQPGFTHDRLPLLPPTLWSRPGKKRQMLLLNSAGCPQVEKMIAFAGWYYDRIRSKASETPLLQGAGAKEGN